MARRNIFIAMTAWGNRIISAAVQLITIPLLINLLGIEGYGRFAIIISFSGWMTLLDFGLGNTIQNTISTKRTKEEPYTLDILFLIILLFPMMIVTLIAINIICTFINFKGISSHDLSTFFSIAFLTNIFGICYKVFYGMQLGYLANIFPLIASLLILAFLLIASKLEVTGFRSVLLFYFSPQLIISFCAFLFLTIKLNLLKYTYDLSLKSFVKSAKEFLGRSTRFSLFAVLAALTLQLDYLIMSQFVTLDEIAVYAVSFKFLSFILFFNTGMNQSIWPTLSELTYKSQWKEADKLIRLSILIGSIALLGIGLGLTLAGNNLATILKFNHENIFNTWLWFFMLIYGFIRVWTDSFAMALQSMNRLRSLIFTVPIQAIISIVLQIFLCKSIGVIGIPIAISVSFILSVAWILPLEYKRIRLISVKLNQ